jgi:NAD(P)H-dependent flavin oxidoreductase YrpB (nitropropane dioxygenase family)
MMETIDEFYKTQAVRPLREGAHLSLRPIRIGDLEIPAPIFQGDMGVAFSTPRLAASVAAHGGVGVLSAEQAGCLDADYARDAAAANVRALRRDVQAALSEIRGLARKGAVAVNIICASTQYEALVRAAVEAGAQMIISGVGLPVALPGIVRDANVKLTPIVSSARAIALLRRSWAKKYNRAPDAVIFAGPRAGGHLGFKEERLDEAEDRFYQTILEIKGELADLSNCPLIVSNGAMKQADVKKALAYGADGIQAEEVFALAAECGAPENLKGVYAPANRWETAIVKSPAGMSVRILRNKLAEEILKGGVAPRHCVNCLHNCPKKDISFCLAEALAATARGDAENGVLFSVDRSRGEDPPGTAARSRGREPVTVADIFRALSG